MARMGKCESLHIYEEEEREVCVLKFGAARKGEGGWGETSGQVTESKQNPTTGSSQIFVRADRFSNNTVAKTLFQRVCLSGDESYSDFYFYFCSLVESLILRKEKLHKIIVYTNYYS